MESSVAIHMKEADTARDGCFNPAMRPTGALQGGLTGALPRFSMGRFSDTMKKGFHEQKRRQEESRKQRDSETAMWVTPGMRPLAEPPIMEWDKILEEEFSDARLNALFAGNPEKQCLIKDLHGELLAIGNYREWSAADGFAAQDGCSARQAFRDELHSDICVERESVMEEWWALYNTATRLGQWEHAWLDHDGKTTKILHELKIGLMDVFSTSEEAAVKYKYLVPTGYEATPLGRFEYEWLDEDGGTSRREEELKLGHNIFRSRPEEVQNKYAEIMARHLDSIIEFECDYDVESWGMYNIEERLRNGRDVFEGRDDRVREKYGHLMALFNPNANWPPEEWSNPTIHTMIEEFQGDDYWDCVVERAT